MSDNQTKGSEKTQLTVNVNTIRDIDIKEELALVRENIKNQPTATRKYLSEHFKAN